MAARANSIRQEWLVEVAGVELFNVLTARNLLILRMPRRTKNAALPGSLYVYCTKILSRPCRATAIKSRVSHTLPLWRENNLVLPIPFAGFRNLSYQLAAGSLHRRTTCSTPGLSHSHCSCLLRPLSRKINPGWTGTSRSAMKSCAFVVTTAKS
jgi:hypothetical protein